MQRTISAMVGKGSVNHNSRKFHAKNTDPNRTENNTEYCNEPIREVYHKLFDEALKQYNEKQTRADRVIPDYYEKIRSSKQEKPFHELILQIGDKDNMSAMTEDGARAKEILDEYYRGFQARNPNLYVLSAHLHMDEATPHLHIDFVPFTTGSKRGLGTRVSLKKALAAQGFEGGTRGDTEWNQWVQSEKEQLAAVMERHGIEWQHKGTHEKHLSVLDYEKQQREKEIEEMKTQAQEMELTLEGFQNAVSVAEEKFKDLQEDSVDLAKQIEEYNQPGWMLPQPQRFMSAKAFRDQIIGLFNKMRATMLKALSKCYEYAREYALAKRDLDKAYYTVLCQQDTIKDQEYQIEQMTPDAKRYRMLRKFLGPNSTDELLRQAQQKETQKQRSHVRGRYEER